MQGKTGQPSQQRVVGRRVQRWHALEGHRRQSGHGGLGAAQARASARFPPQARRVSERSRRACKKPCQRTDQRVPCVRPGAGDIITAAIAYLAHSTSEPLRFSATDFNSYVTVHNATGAPQRVAGRMSASDEPGLGIEPDREVLGAPVAVFEG